MGSYGDREAEFTLPEGIAVDAEGCLYVADTLNNRIQKFTTDGGLIAETWGNSEFHLPHGITIDGQGYVYVADTGNHSIKKFFSDGSLILRGRVWEWQ